MSSTQYEDPTRVVESADQEYIPFGPIPGAEFKVLVANETLNKVIFKFRFAPGTVLPPHTHDCHAIAYTLSGEWEYEGLRLPAESIAYEPVGSTHTPSSDTGAEIVVILSSDTDRFIVNHMPDGSELVFDMAFFKAFEGCTSEQAAATMAAMAQA